MYQIYDFKMISLLIHSKKVFLYQRETIYELSFQHKEDINSFK